MTCCWFQAGSPKGDHRLHSRLHRDELLQGDLDVPQVPQDPETLANEDQQRPCEDEEVPEVNRSEDADEEQYEAHCVQENGHKEDAQAASDEAGAIHDRKKLL